MLTHLIGFLGAILARRKARTSTDECVMTTERDHSAASQWTAAANLSTSEVTRHGLIESRSVTLGEFQVARVEFGVGARWRTDAGALTGADWCEARHHVMVLTGSLQLMLRTGESPLLRTGDVAVIPPGHDAWTVGATACVFLEIESAEV